MSLQSASQALVKFKTALSSNDLAGAEAQLAHLKLQLIHLPSLPPVFGDSPTAQEELLLARDAYEHAALLSLRTKDEASMERAFSQLQAFYADTKSCLPPSSQELTMQGLNLLRLLVQNRIAEFHTELELVPWELRSEAPIQQPVQLEQWLMEGAYNKVLEAAKGSSASSDVQGALMAQLTHTVREEVASCSAKAYEKLAVSEAQRMLLMGSEDEVRAYAAKHEWRVDGAHIVFPSDSSMDSVTQVPSMDIIRNALAYAKELERIV